LGILLTFAEIAMSLQLDNDKEIGRESPSEAAVKPTREFPTWGDLLVMLAIFFAASIVAAVVMMVLRAAWNGIEKEFLTAVTYATQFSLAIAGILLFRRLRGAKKRVFHFALRWYNASLVVLGLVLMVAASVAMEPLLALFPDKYFEMLNSAVGSGGWAIFTTVVLAPVCEEMLFRGLILESIRQKRGATAAVILSALLFGLVHVPVLPQMLNAFVMGVMLGYVYVLTGSLASVIIIHAANNALAFLIMEVTGNRQFELRDIMGDGTLYWIIFGISVVVFIAATVGMALLATKKRQRRIELTAIFASVPAEKREEL
jgi:membrane protease YdiL (CAAX protease family)